jgi:hypothetical protein
LPERAGKPFFHLAKVRVGRSNRLARSKSPKGFLEIDRFEENAWAPHGYQRRQEAGGVVGGDQRTLEAQQWRLG